MEPRPVAVAVVGSRVEADLIVGMLDNNGIRAHTAPDDVGGIDLALQAQGVPVLVSAADAAAAKRLLHDDSASPTDARDLNVFQRLTVRLLGGRSS